MNGDERRKKIINILSSSKSPVAGVALAKELDVSRQVIVQDIALLRANGAAIFSTNRGYLIQADKQYSRVLKVVHEDDEVEEELSTIVDAGGHVKDVFVYHKVYGVIRANMDIKSRRDVRNYLEEIRTGKSSLLKNVTSGYHYHTICAESEEVLDAILILGRQQDISVENTYDTSLMEAFRIPSGTAVELYATTLHYAPCNASDGGFLVAIVLPKGTNEALEHPHTGGED